MSDLEYITVLTDGAAHVGMVTRGTDLANVDVRTVACGKLSRYGGEVRVVGKRTDTPGAGLTRARLAAQTEGLRVCQECTRYAQRLLQRR